MKADDLKGKWKIKRVVCHPEGAQKSSMRGSGHFHLLNASELLYQEHLWHETENHDLLFASKAYRYIFKEEELEIYFHQEENNRLFLTLPMKRKMTGTALCREDHYHLLWEWVNRDKFLTRYTVKGTNKDYIIESEFRRCVE